MKDTLKGLKVTNERQDNETRVVGKILQMLGDEGLTKSLT